MFFCVVCLCFLAPAQADSLENWVVITSINEPTKAVLMGWQVVVVGDEKPSRQDYLSKVPEGSALHYLDVVEQKRLEWSREMADDQHAGLVSLVQKGGQSGLQRVAQLGGVSVGHQRAKDKVVVDGVVGNSRLSTAMGGRWLCRCGLISGRSSSTARSGAGTRQRRRRMSAVYRARVSHAA